MTTTRNRRWILAIVAIVVVAGVLGFVAFREDPKDVPRLVILGQEQVNGEKRVVFRFDAPKHKEVLLGTNLRTQNPSTRMERRIEPAWDSFIIVLPGNSTEISVIAPVDEVWRLRGNVGMEGTRIKDVLGRVESCWREKSFAPLRRKTHWLSSFSKKMIIESEPITNAVPRTGDAPAQ